VLNLLAKGAGRHLEIEILKPFIVFCPDLEKIIGVNIGINR